MINNKWGSEFKNYISTSFYLKISKTHYMNLYNFISNYVTYYNQHKNSKSNQNVFFRFNLLFFSYISLKLN